MKPIRVNEEAKFLETKAKEWVEHNPDNRSSIAFFTELNREEKTFSIYGAFDGVDNILIMTMVAIMRRNPEVYDILKKAFEEYVNFQEELMKTKGN